VEALLKDHGLQTKGVLSGKVYGARKKQTKALERLTDEQPVSKRKGGGKERKNSESKIGQWVTRP